MSGRRSRGRPSRSRRSLTGRRERDSNSDQHRSQRSSSSSSSQQEEEWTSSDQVPLFRRLQDQTRNRSNSPVGTSRSRRRSASSPTSAPDDTHSPRRRLRSPPTAAAVAQAEPSSAERMPPPPTHVPPVDMRPSTSTGQRGGVPPPRRNFLHDSSSDSDTDTISVPDEPVLALPVLTILGDDRTPNVDVPVPDEPAQVLTVPRNRPGRPCHPGNERRPGETDLEYRRRRKANNRRLALERQRLAQLFQNLQAVGPTTEYQRNDLGEMNLICQHCRARHFRHEKLRTSNNFAPCCNSGKVRLDLPRVHPVIQRLMTKEDNFHAEARFMENIRSYNGALSFMSVGGSCPQIDGPPNYRVFGRMHHRLSAFHPHPGQRPEYAQLYTIDTGMAHQLRQNMWTLNGDLLNVLENVLNEVNPYALTYKSGARIMEEQRIAAQLAGNEVPDVRIVFRAPDTANRVRVNQPGEQPHPGRLNLPEVSEIAAVYTHRENAINGLIHQVIYPLPAAEQERLQADGVHAPQVNINAPYNVHPPIYGDDNYPGIVVSTNSHLWEPMTYTMQRPYGEFGWSPGILYTDAALRRTRATITHMDYAMYHMQDRGVFNPLLSSGRLFQQWSCDMFLAAESAKLEYIRHNQHLFRRETYGGLADYVVQAVIDGQERRGTRVYLPSSVTGSPRWYALHYHDSMSLVRQMGKPDLLITFTCNTAWEEMRRSKEPYQEVALRNDLICRVFRGKLEAFLSELLERRCFGDWLYYTWVVEFQKRGLPHVHLILALADAYKPVTTERIDQLISAEIPDPEVDVQLYETVTKTMLHGPCGASFPNRICMRGGRCSKNYPKEYCNQTSRVEDGYPEYRRRRGPTHTVRVNAENPAYVLDNRWVVPYSPYLTKIFNTHINVEVISTVGAVKYIFKYLSKGSDMVEAMITAALEAEAEQHANDEIWSFQTFKYTSSMEAVWRLLDMPMHGKSHTVQQLHVHIESQQMVLFREGEEAQAIANMKDTTLIGWLKSNRDNPEFRHHLYEEYVKDFRWRDNKWVRRQREQSCPTIGRMYSVSPRNHELFALRLLLTRIRGAQNWADLKRGPEPERILFDTHVDAARAHGLINDDAEFIAAMEEAADLVANAHQLREMFAFYLSFNNPGNALNVFEQFSEELCADFTHAGHQIDYAMQRALQHIRSIVRINGQDLQNFGLPELEDLTHDEVQPINRQQEQAMADAIVPNLNVEQRQVFDAILATQEPGYDGPRQFFMDGPGGTGKTFTYNAIIHTLRAQRRSVIATAWTGIAALLLPGGRTAHHFFKLPVPVDDNSNSSVTVQSAHGQFLASVDVIIWDEISMVPVSALRAVDRLLRDIKGRDNDLFGGMVILFGGDFRQLAPVTPNANPAQTAAQSVRQYEHWNTFQRFALRTNMRVGRDQNEFANYILGIGDGTDHVPGEDNEIFHRLRPDIVMEGTMEDLVREIFCDRDGNLLEATADRAILAPKHDHCDAINNLILDRLNTEERIYLSTDTVDATEGDDPHLDWQPEYLNSLNPGGLPPHRMRLKVNAQVVLLRNMNTASGLVNGSRGVIEHMTDHVIQIRMLTGDLQNTIVFMPRISLSPSTASAPVQWSRRQFPVKVSYCMTINRAQGATYNLAGVYLPEPVFGHGQLYVAVSRVTSPNRLRVLLTHPPFTDDVPDTITKNIVYRTLIT